MSYARTTNSAHSTDTSLVTASIPSELSPIEAAIMAACNALHEARQRADGAAELELGDRLMALLDRYDATDGENHPAPAWARPNQRALVLSAMGRLDQAIALEEIALRYADSLRRKEISAGNLAERCLRAGRAREAVEWFLTAHDANPDSLPVLITGAQALCAVGLTDEADRIFEVLADQPALLGPQSELGAYLDYEPRLRQIAPELPSLARLLDLWDAKRPACLIDARDDSDDSGDRSSEGRASS